jgi:ribitol-5-phosphate 2-dehydrogenase
MRELIPLDPSRVVAFKDESEYCFCIAELVSTAVHAVKRLLKSAHSHREKIAVFGDGSLGFLTALVIKKMLPQTHVMVMGKHYEKMIRFSFADDIFLKLPEDLNFDHAFECAGGTGSISAVNSIVKFINPQGTAVLMGVSEEKVPVNTRAILEKGLTFIGSSRSGREDFETAVNFLEDENFINRVKTIISLGNEVCGIADIHEIFLKASSEPFKLVFKWGI